MCLVAGLLLCGLFSLERTLAQGVDPNLMREAAAVRAEVARSRDALRDYTWTEHTEVSVKGEVKSSTAATCRYNRNGDISKTPIGAAEEQKKANATAKRVVTRKKAEMQDYIERAVSTIQDYVPPKPEQIDHLLQTGSASLGQSADGKSEVRLSNYYQEGDSMVFTYDSASKVLLLAHIASTLGSPKDPVTLDAVFEKLPDGVNHLSSTTLSAPSKKIQVKTRNVMYQKVN
jgi:hypothetical protein